MLYKHWTAHDWNFLLETDDRGEIPTEDKIPFMVPPSMSYKVWIDNNGHVCRHHGVPLERNFASNNPPHQKIYEATPDNLRGHYSRPRFNLPSELMMINLKDSNSEMQAFYRYICKQQDIEPENQIPIYVKNMYRIRYWLAFMSQVEQLEMEYDAHYKIHNRPNGSPDGDFSDFRPYNVPFEQLPEKFKRLTDLHSKHVLIPAADMCSNKYLLNIATPVSTVNKFLV
jgi:hypothetical protein